MWFGSALGTFHEKLEAGTATLMCACVERHKHTAQVEGLLIYVVGF